MSVCSPRKKSGTVSRLPYFPNPPIRTQITSKSLSSVYKEIGDKLVATYVLFGIYVGWD